MTLDNDRAMVRLRWSFWRSTVRAACDVGVLRRRRVGHNREQPKVVVEETVLEVARLVETIEAISLHEKEQEVEVAIAREEIHSRSEPVKGDITYR